MIARSSGVNRSAALAGMTMRGAMTPATAGPARPQRASDRKRNWRTEISRATHSAPAIQRARISRAGAWATASEAWPTSVRGVPGSGIQRAAGGGKRAATAATGTQVHRQ